MVVDFKRQILDLDNNPIPSQENKNGSATLILSVIAINALLSRFSDEKDITGQSMVDRFELALRIKNADVPGVEVQAEEISLIKNLIAKGHGPLVCGRAWKLLETPVAPTK